MAIYTVHQPPPRRYESTPDPERFRFVRDGFSFWAFLLGPLWMLRHRMWLVLIGYAATTTVVEVALHYVGASTGTQIFAGLLLSLLVGIEAGTLRRFTLGRRRWIHVGMVVGDDIEAAERRFFDAWVKAEGPLPPPSAAPLAGATLRPAPAAPEVIGLFPEPGAQR